MRFSLKTQKKQELVMKFRKKIKIEQQDIS